MIVTDGGSGAGAKHETAARETNSCCSQIVSSCPGRQDRRKVIAETLLQKGPRNVTVEM